MLKEVITMTFDWNRERRRTRDRLLDLQLTMLPPHPNNVELPIIYPWSNITRVEIERQLFSIVQAYGYTGTPEQFFSTFSNISSNIINGRVHEFPVPGVNNCLYLDKDTDILYCFKEVREYISPETAETMGAVIVGQFVDEETQNTITYLYIPIRSLLIADTILNGGDAAEYID